MTATDITGLGVSTKSADALAAYERGLDLFLRWRTGSLEALDAAAQSDPRFALAYCTKAYIAWRMGRADLATAASRQATAVGDDARPSASACTSRRSMPCSAVIIPRPVTSSARSPP